jgi:hypothetical protein
MGTTEDHRYQMERLIKITIRKNIELYQALAQNTNNSTKLGVALLPFQQEGG